MPKIVVDDLTHPDVHALLAAHEATMRQTTLDTAACHPLALDALRDPTVTVWTAWADDTLLGCGALKALGDADAEIKSMHTLAAARGKGVGRAILEVIVVEARARGHRRLLLETGTATAFAPARALYLRRGFAPTGPFADYPEHSESVFLALTLDEPADA